MEGIEQQLRADIPVFINSFNQPTYLRDIIETLLDNRFGKIVICDNASSSPKTLALLDALGRGAAVEVRHLGSNLGPHKTFERIRAETRGPFAFTDPDLALSPQLPADFLSRLLDLSRKYSCKKVGLALEIPSPEECRDLVYRNPSLGEFAVRDWEQRFWEQPIEEGVYRADVDTTFFLWNPAVRFDLRRIYGSARRRMRPARVRAALPTFRHTDLRVALKGFTARHLPWYKDDGFPEDEREFYVREAARWSTWLRGSGSENAPQ